MKSEKMDIIETAVSAGSFETLATAIKAAGLVGALKGDGPFTVFAPTDEAFAALPEGTLESLLNDKEPLTAILTYHVVPGELKGGYRVLEGGADVDDVYSFALLHYIAFGLQLDI